MAKVRPGMPQDEVRALLGEPGDVRTCAELRGYVNGNREIWCYGTDGHLTFPTLGCVYIGESGRTQYAYGGAGRPPDPGTFSEPQLRALLRVIDRSPEINGDWYHPGRVIEVVNALQPLGKDRALAAVDEYLRVASQSHSDARQGLFLVLRVLFDVPAKPGYLPAPHLGAPEPGSPADLRLLPRFPIALVDDVPLLLVQGYNLAGVAEPVEDHVAYFRAEGRLRARPLRPPDRPLAVWEHLPPAVRAYADRVGRRLYPRGEHYLQRQWSRLVYSVYRRPGLAIEENGARFDGYWPEGLTWATVTAAVDALALRWDARRCRYTFRDGSALPPPPRYAPAVWEVKQFGFRLKLSILRQDEGVVNVEVLEVEAPGPPPRPASLRVYRPGREGKPLAEFEVGVRGRGQGWLGRRLGRGEPVQVELRAGDEVVRSPVYRP